MNWASHPALPRPAWVNGTTGREPPWRNGDDHNLLRRTTADGHRLEFGLHVLGWEHRPRIAWFTPKISCSTTTPPFCPRAPRSSMVLMAPANFGKRWAKMPGRDSAVMPEAGCSAGEALRRMLAPAVCRSRALVGITLGYGLVTIVGYAMTAFAPLYAIEVLGADPREANPALTGGRHA